MRAIAFPIGARGTQAFARLAGVVAVAAAASVAGAAGLPDPSFMPLSGSATASPIAIAPDGRIGFGGRSQGSISHNLPFLAVLDDHGANSAGFVYAYDSTLGTSATPSALAFDAAGRVVVAWSLASPWAMVVARYRSDGQPSATFARTQSATATPARSLAIPSALVLDGQGRPVVGGSSPPKRRAIVARLHRDGGYDEAFGAGGEVLLGSPDAVEDARVAALGTDAQGGIVVVHGTTSRLSMQRLDSQGAIDTTFGLGGIATVDDAVAATVDRLGRVIVATAQSPGPGSTLRRFVDGRPDPTFGVGGSAALAAKAAALATDSPGNVYAGFVETTNASADYRVVRVRSEGTVDTAYGIGGMATASLPLKPAIPPYPAEIAYPPILAVDDYGRLVMAAPRTVQIIGQVFGGNTTFFRFTGDTPPPPATALAIEYFHAGFGHYFTTANPDEIAALDAGAFADWSRTGEAFTVVARSTGEALPACRFFSGATFAPKSSHFYTPYPGECDTVGSSAEWSFEKIAYLLQLPDDVGMGNGTCPPNLRPLYRAFNRMQGGAPNHRYTTSASTLDAMLAAGWALEGEANTRVFACVPP